MDHWEIYYRTHAKGIGNVLTGSPLLTFVSNGQPLADYRIYGNSGGVGDLITDETDLNYGKYKIPVTVSGKNLFDGYLEKGTISSFNGVGSNSDTRVRSNYILVKPNMNYVISVENKTGWVLLYNRSIQKVGRYPLPDGDIEYPFAYYPISFPTTSDTAYIRFVVVADSIDVAEGIQLGEKAVTTNIYLDEPLNEGESISMSDTGISIPTINGTNILTVDTAVQPSKMYIKYGDSGNVNQALIKYLEYKYKFAKE